MIHAILTMDDIPSQNTCAIVDYLNSKGIQAVMFAVGNRLERTPDPAVYALQHGMIVGNHSYSHPSFSSLSVEDGIREIDACDRLLDQVYASAGIPRTWRPFRFPYGDKGGEHKSELQQVLKDRAFSKLKDSQIPWSWWKAQGLDQDIDTFWTFDFAEYQIRPGSGFTLDDVCKRIHDPHPVSGAPLLEENSSHILLLHAHDDTEALVPEYYRKLIDHLLELGIVFDAPAFV